MAFHRPYFLICGIFRYQHRAVRLVDCVGSVSTKAKRVGDFSRLVVRMVFQCDRIVYFLQDIEGVLAQHPGMCTPNVKRSVYKNRRGKFNRVICWMLANKGTCRYKTLFVTDFSFKPIDKDEIFQKKKE